MCIFEGGLKIRRSVDNRLGAITRMVLIEVLSEGVGATRSSTVVVSLVAKNRFGLLFHLKRRSSRAIAAVVNFPSHEKRTQYNQTAKNTNNDTNDDVSRFGRETAAIAIRRL